MKLLSTARQPWLITGVWRQGLVVGAIALGFVMNVWTNLAPPNGRNIGEIANTTFAEVMIIPANYAFAIWGLIYLGLFTLAVFQAQRPRRNHPALDAIGTGLIGASVCQTGWIFAFLYGFYGVSMLAMLGILGALIGAYQVSSQARASRMGRGLVQAPVSLYLGWIAVATVVNGAIALTAAGWDGWGLSPMVWTIAMMVVATAIALLLVWRRSDAVYGGVTVWAWVALGVRHWVAMWPLAIVALGLAAVVLGAIALRIVRPVERPSGLRM